MLQKQRTHAHDFPAGAKQKPWHCAESKCRLCRPIPEIHTDFHPLTPAAGVQDFLAGAHAPIVIEDDVFIGMQSLIRKGVTIGRGSVVGAGSVVTRDVPAGVVAGNPATVVKELENS